MQQSHYATIANVGARFAAMTPDAFNAFCAALPAATYVCQWGGSHVWKVGSKVFAIGSWDEPFAGITFKVSEMAFEILPTLPGVRPAPYLASRGMKWVQHYAEPGLSQADLRAYLTESHRIVAMGLSGRQRRVLGIGDLPLNTRAGD